MTERETGRQPNAGRTEVSKSRYTRALASSLVLRCCSGRVERDRNTAQHKGSGDRLVQRYLCTSQLAVLIVTETTHSTLHKGSVSVKVEVDVLGSRP